MPCTLKLHDTTTPACCTQPEPCDSPSAKVVRAPKCMRVVTFHTTLAASSAELQPSGISAFSLNTTHRLLRICCVILPNAQCPMPSSVMTTPGGPAVQLGPYQGGQSSC